MKKSKQDKNLTEPQKQKPPTCQVCWTPNHEIKIRSTRSKQAEEERRAALELYQCASCKGLVHKYCYDPSLHDQKNWKCDFCKHLKTKNSKQECFICKCEGKMLKHVQDNKFAHIFCALASDMLLLENFKTLKFRLNPEFKPKELKDSTPKFKENLKCSFCKKDSHDVIFKCYHTDCTYAAHIPCLLQNRYQKESIDDDIIFNLLNQTVGSFRIKNQDFLKINYETFRGLQILDKPKRSIPYITCQPHSNEMKWCTKCYRANLDLGMQECSRCRRWAHEECSKMKNKSENGYIECDACISDQIYLQRALFPDQIMRLVKIETSSSKLTFGQLKYLDAFAFRCSGEVEKQLLTKINRQQFECYHLYNFLEKQFLMGYSNKKDEKDKRVEPVEKILEKLPSYMKDFSSKKILQILYYLKYKDYRSKNELNTPNDINDLRTVYPKTNVNINAKKLAEQERCKKILNKFLDLCIKNLKQAEIKDVSIKIVQFSDYIRKQIAYVKDDTSEVSDTKKMRKKEKLQNLMEKLKKRPHIIAQQIREMLKMISQNKDKLKGKFEWQPETHQDQNAPINKAAKSSKSKQSQTNNFLMTLIRCVAATDEGFESQMFETQDLMDLIDSYRKLIYVSRVASKKPQKKLALSEEEYYKIINKFYHASKTTISEESKVRISRFFKQLVKDHNIKDALQIKSEITQKYDQLIQEDRLNYNQTLAMRENLAQHAVFLDRHSKMLTIQKRATYYRVLKIKYMKIVRLQLDSENAGRNFFLRPNEKNRKDIIDNVRRLLEANGKSLKLKEDQKSALEYFLVKEQVFTNILREEMILGSKLEAYNPSKLSETSKIQVEGQQSGRMPQESQGQQSVNGLVGKGELTVLERIKRIFKYWMKNTLENPYQIIKILYPIAEKRIKFGLEYQEAFNELIESIGNRVELLLRCEDQNLRGSYPSVHRVNSDEFIKLWKLIEYAQLQNAFEKLKNINEEYSEWLRDLQGRYNPIGKVLEDKFLNGELLEVIDRKISEASRFEIDLKMEVKKLKTVKLWVVLSQKFQKDFERKPTINAIQQFKLFMVKINYPHNAIYQQVVELDNYGRHLNEKIEKFLKKQNYDQLEFYEEICLLNSKMSLREAEELKLQLENCKLDVNGELQTLEEEIANYFTIPFKLEPYLKREDNLDEIIKIKTMILQSPIRYENLESYCQLYHRICYLKCLTLQGNVNRKEFFRLLNHSELGAAILTEKMPQLLKAYRELQKAEKQSRSAKPKWELLLPVDGRKIILELANDPTTLAQVENYYQKHESLRQKLRALKNTKQPYERFVVLENEISQLPINYKDVQAEINKMKLEMDSLVQRGTELKKNFNPSKARDILRQYQKLGMRHPDLEWVRKVYEAYSSCLSLSQAQDDYVEFADKLKKHPELNSIITLNETRSQLFAEYSQEALEQWADPGSQNNVDLLMLHALIQEGAFVLGYVIPMSKDSAPLREKTLTTLLKLNKKIDDLAKTSTPKAKRTKNPLADQEKDPYSDEADSADYDEDGSQMYDDEFDDQDELEDDEDDEDELGYEDEEEEESMPQPPKKRSQPLVMEISDEEEQVAAPSPKKAVHVNPSGVPAPEMTEGPRQGENQIKAEK